MRVSTGRTVQLRDAMREHEPQENPTRQSVRLEPMETPTSRITDTRYSVFIEIRERGQDSVVCKSAIELKRQVQRGRPSRFQSRYHGYGLSAPAVAEINVIADVRVGDYVEIYVTPKTGILSIRPAKMQNIMTPYVLTYSSNVKPDMETFFSTQSYAVVATPKRREQFARDTYKLANASDEPIHKISALRAMEQLFITMIANDQIERKLAEKKFAVYDKVQELIWRGGTPGEQTSAFARAWSILGNVTGLSQDSKLTFAEHE